MIIKRSRSVDGGSMHLVPKKHNKKKWHSRKFKAEKPKNFLALDIEKTKELEKAKKCKHFELGKCLKNNCRCNVYENYVLNCDEYISLQRKKNGRK